MSRWTTSPIARAAAFPLAPTVVEGCLDLSERPADALFARAFSESLQALSRNDRPCLAGITGHVAESVAEILLADRGWTPVWHFAASGGHGVDLLLLGPGEERMCAIEVKGTLQRGRWPSLTGGKLAQMEVAWLDKADNPAMLDWGLSSADLYGGVVAVNFHDLLYKVALTNDFQSWRPVERLARLDQLNWLDAA